MKTLSVPNKKKDTAIRLILVVGLVLAVMGGFVASHL
jgi:hypothetical protein